VGIEGKIPFYFYFAVVDQMQAVAEGTAVAGTNISVDIPDFQDEEVVIFSWTGAGEVYENIVGEADVPLLYIEWILFGLYALYRILENT